MNTVLFQGPPAALQAKINELIALGAVTMNVVPTSEKSLYLLIWS